MSKPPPEKYHPSSTTTDKNHNSIHEEQFKHSNDNKFLSCHYDNLSKAQQMDSSWTPKIFMPIKLPSELSTSTTSSDEIDIVSYMGEPNLCDN